MIVREEEAWTSDAFWLRLYQCKLPVWGFAPLNVRVLLCYRKAAQCSFHCVLIIPLLFFYIYGCFSALMQYFP